MSARDLAVFCGRTATGNRVWAHIAIEAGADHDVTYTDHTTGPAPERVSIMWTLASPGKGASASTLADRYIISMGQTDQYDRMITDEDSAIPVPTLRAIESAWITSHLNDLNAECDHMTDSMLNPDVETYNAYLANAPESATRYGQALQSYRLDRVVCPETGYRYGHAWLARKVAPEIITALRSAQRLATL